MIADPKKLDDNGSTLAGDEEQGQQLREEFLFELFVGLRNSQLLQNSHEGLMRHALKLRTLIEAIRAVEGTLTLTLADGALLLNDRRLRAGAARASCLEFLVREMAGKNLCYVAFERGVRAEEIAAFLEVFVQSKVSSADLIEKMRHTLAGARVTHIVLDRESDIREASPQQVLRVASVQAYLRSMQAVRKAMEGATSERVVSLQQAARCVHALVDVAHDDENFLLALGQIKNHDEYTYNHCVNVCTYALALGNRLGLDRKLLGKLGLAALFHDLGKTRVPHEVLSKKGQLTQEEWRYIRVHPEAAVGCLSRCPGDSETLAVCAVVALQHHRGVDGSGYGGRPMRKPHIFSRIAMIADIYDALTTPRVYRPNALAPVAVFHKMVRGELGAVDLRLLKVFIRMIGVFPVGSLVEISDGRVAMVTRNHSGLDRMDAPVVRRMSDDGQLAPEAENVDLAQAGMTVVNIVSPSRFFRSSTDYLKAIERL